MYQFPLTHSLEEEIHMDYAHPELITKSGKNVELDVYLPSLKLALEYQGTQHYSQHFLFGSSDSLQVTWNDLCFLITQQRDEEKRNLCKLSNITLIAIPYWWDSTKESLYATVYKYRADLVSDLPDDASPIPETPPKGGKLYSGLSCHGKK